MEGRNYLGLTIYWKHSKEYVDILMPEYVKKVMDRLKHPKAKIPQYAPHLWTVPTYEKIPQASPDIDDRELIDNKSTKTIQSIVGAMIYCSP